VPKPERRTITLDDLTTDLRLHAVWSRSGANLGVSISKAGGQDYRQIGLRPEQVEALIAFLAETLTSAPADR
jgi:hypothetical protein